MNERINDSLAAMNGAGYAALANRVGVAVRTKPRLKQTEIEAALSLGWRGFGSKKEDITLRRRLCRAVMLARIVLERDAIAKAQTDWKDKTQDQITRELTRLQGREAAAAVRSVGRPMLSGRAAGKHYNWLKQQTHTDGAIDDEGAARARGFVQQTIGGVWTGRWVAEDGGDSCGPTTVAMAYYYITGRAMPEGLMRDMAAAEPKGYHAAGVGTGTFEVALAAVLNKVGHGVHTGWTSRRIPTGRLADWTRTHVTKTTPVIFNVGWHFSLGVEIVAASVVCLDPWFGPTEAALASCPAYPRPGKAFNGWVVFAERT